MNVTRTLFFLLLPVTLFAATPPYKTNDPATDEDFRDIYEKMATHTHSNDGSTVISTSQDGNPIGTVVMYTSSTAPSKWLLCDGSSISTTTYSRLFAVIGTTYGGAGANFNVPDFRGVFPKGAGTTNRAAGKDSSGNFYAATIGAYVTDMMQGHWHNLLHYGASQTSIPTANSGVSGNSRVMHGSGVDDGQQIEVQVPRSDGTNGTPRTGHTTEPQSLGITFIIYAGI